MGDGGWGMGSVVTGINSKDRVAKPVCLLYYESSLADYLPMTSGQGNPVPLEGANTKFESSLILPQRSQTWQSEYLSSAISACSAVRISLHRGRLRANSSAFPASKMLSSLRRANSIGRQSVVPQRGQSGCVAATVKGRSSICAATHQ